MREDNEIRRANNSKSLVFTIGWTSGGKAASVCLLCLCGGLTSDAAGLLCNHFEREKSVLVVGRTSENF